MTRRRSVVSRVASSRVVDDFKVIRGIGPVNEKHFHDAGIRTFAQLAKLSPEDVATHIPNLTANQIRSQGWIHQAHKLASRKTASKPQKKRPAHPTVSQHYENFTLEFLLNEKNKIRRLRIMHVQSGDVDTWSKWDTERLIAFLAWHSGTGLPHARLTVPTLAKPEPASDVRLPNQPLTIVTNAPIPSKAPVLGENVPPETIQLPVRPISTSAPNQIHLLEWKTLLANTDQSVHNLAHDQTFDIRLIFELTNSFLPETSQLDFTIKLYAKKMGGGHKQLIGETQNKIAYSNIVRLTISSVNLPQGLYRLETLLNLVAIECSSRNGSSAEVVFQGGLLQVY